MPSHTNIEVNQSVFGSYLWVSFASKSVCRFLFCYVLVCGLLLHSTVNRKEQALIIVKFAIVYLFFVHSRADSYVSELLRLMSIGA